MQIQWREEGDCCKVHWQMECKVIIRIDDLGYIRKIWRNVCLFAGVYQFNYINRSTAVINTINIFIFIVNSCNV